MDKNFTGRWKIPFAGFLLALMGGISYAWGVFVVPMTKTYGWSSAEAALPLTVFMVVFSIVMVPAGRLQDKIGPKKVATIGAVLFFVAYGLASLVSYYPYPWWLVLTYGFIGGIACGLTYACVAPPARKWFPDKPGLAISFAVMGFGLAAVLIAPLKADYLIPNYGIDGTLFILAVVSSSVCLLAAWLIKNPDIDYLPSGWVDTSDTQVFIYDQNLTPAEVIHKPLFKMIWLMFAFVVAGGLIAIGLIPAYAEKVLLASPIEAALAISIFAGFNGFGRPLAGYLSDRYGALKVMTVTYVTQAIIFLVFPILAISVPTLYLSAAFLGWGYAVTLALFPTLTSLSFGVKNMGVNYGLVFTAFGVGAFSPLIGSWVFDMTSNYTYVFMFAGIITGVGQLLSVYINRKYPLFKTLI